MDIKIPEKLLKEAVRFHGHLGPFMILGLKAGLLANKLLGKDYFKTKAIITTKPKTPYTCFLDGIQFATGCTVGKGNIRLEKGEGILTVLFIKDNKRLKLTLKADLLKKIEKISMEECEQVARDLQKTPIEDLFHITENHS